MFLYFPNSVSRGRLTYDPQVGLFSTIVTSCVFTTHTHRRLYRINTRVHACKQTPMDLFTYSLRAELSASARVFTAVALNMKCGAPVLAGRQGL